MARPVRAKHFLLTPPMGSTRPRTVISQSIATSFLTRARSWR